MEQEKVNGTKNEAGTPYPCGLFRLFRLFRCFLDRSGKIK